MSTLSSQQITELKRRGLSDSVIKGIAEKKGLSVPSDSGIISGFAKGALKGFVGDIARPTAQAFQGIGQRVLAGVSPSSLSEVRGSTGLNSLNDSTREGRGVVQSLQTQGGSELAGRVGANIASFFIPTSPAITGGARTLQSFGRGINKLGIGLSSKEAPLVQVYKARTSVPERIYNALTGQRTAPATNAETALKNKLFGTKSMVGVQARKAADKIWGQVISPALKRSKVEVNMGSFIDDMKREVDSVVELSRKRELTKALNSFADDYKNVESVTLEQLQKLKEGWTTFLPDKTFKGKPVGASFKEIQNIASSLARNTIYKAIPEIDARAAYLDYGNLINLQKMGQRAMTNQGLKGGFGTFASTLFQSAVTPVATTGGLALYQVGRFGEFVGRPGIKILGHIFK